MHQVNMRLSTTLLRDPAAEKRAKERAEARKLEAQSKEPPTVKTEAETLAEEAAKEKEASKSKEKRKFKPLAEAKAVDLFADVIGDAFILVTATGLLLWEYLRQSKKPDSNAVRISELDEDIKEKDKKIAELEELERQQEKRLDALEQALEELKRPKHKVKGLLTS